MTEQPKTRYTRSADGLYIAYQAIGDGPMDVVIMPMNWSNVELHWEEPIASRFFRHLGSLGRLILFDKRGSGLSDPVPLRAIPTVEEWVDDLMTVLDAVGSEQAHLIGIDAGGPVALVAAGTHGARISSLVLFNAFARLGRGPGYAWGPPDSLQEIVLAAFPDNFASGVFPEVMFPSRINDLVFREWWAQFGRQSVGLGAAIQMQQAVPETDVRDILGAVRQPTLVMHRAGNEFVRVAHGRYLAEHLPNATYVELPGADHPFNSCGVDEIDEIAEQIEEFLTGARHTPNVDRVLATVVFTDIVNSTVQTAAASDPR